MRNDWTAMETTEKVKMVRDLASKGMSASEIAAHFTCASRNAIIGFAHRHEIALGKSKRSQGKPATKPPGHKPQPKKKTATSNGKEEVPLEPEITGVVIPFVRPTGPVSILILDSKTCRWPLNKSYRGMFAEEMLFCGKDAQADVYCEECIKKFRPYNGLARTGPILGDNGEPRKPQIRKRRPLEQWRT